MRKVIYPDYGLYKPLAQTTIKFKEMRRCHVRVFLWHSKRQLRQVVNVHDYSTRSRTMSRATAFAHVLPKNAKTGFLGDVHFCAGEISVDHVAHEVNHITTFWAYYNKYSIEPGPKKGPDYNEKMARIQGNFTRHIWKWLGNQKVVIYL